MKTTKKDIVQLFDHIKMVLDRMLELKKMMRGSLGTTYRRCGKSTCWCADSKVKGHPVTKLMWNSSTGPKSRSVQEDQIKSTSEAIQQFREFKQLRKKLQGKQQQLDILLNSFENKTSSENRKAMGFE
jgi:hypothetical protein